MSGVIIEELDSSSESGFATPRSEHSSEDFHEADNAFQEEKDNLQHGSSHLSSSNHAQESSEGTRSMQDKAESPESEQTEDHDSPLASSSERQADCNGSEVVEQAEERPSQETLDKADRLKEEGNSLYAEGSFPGALERYKQALELLPGSAPHQRSILFANSAAASIKLEDYATAAKECSAALELNPPKHIEVKALTRRSLAYEKLDDLERALADYEKLVTLDSATLSHRAAVRRLKPIVEERREKMKDEMLGKLKDLGNTVLGKFGMSLDNFKAEKDPTTGSYSINFKQ